jgi:hypothetical protein
MGPLVLLSSEWEETIHLKDEMWARRILLFDGLCRDGLGVFTPLGGLSVYPV